MASALVGDEFMLQWSDLSANDLFVRIRTTMPQENPRSLADDVYLDVLTYIFQANKFPAGQLELKHDPGVLKAITISKGKN
jgi:quinoprotein glucose dehydrogenase